MRTPIEITYFAKADHKIVNGYGHSVTPRPVTRRAERTWKKQAKSWLSVTPGASHAVVRFEDGTEETVHAK